MTNSSKRVGMIGTGAISHKHAQAYRNIGWSVACCTDKIAETGKKFAERYGAEFVPTWQEVCRHPAVDVVDVCTFPDFRLEPVELAAKLHKPIQVQKPMATSIKTAVAMIDCAREAGIILGVASQHRFDDSTQFVKRAIDAGRLGRILQADAYVKWWRPPAYYSRPIKGSWTVEGGGALINQAIHQIDVVLWLIGPVREVTGEWQLGAVHKIESEDVVCAVMRYASGATGVIQASTAFRPGYPERIEIHGTRGTAIITGDTLTTWDVENDSGDPPPLDLNIASGASDPMAISLATFERQFLDFGEAIDRNQAPLVSGEEGYKALQLVLAIYRSCREDRKVVVNG